MGKFDCSYVCLQDILKFFNLTLTTAPEPPSPRHCILSAGVWCQDKQWWILVLQALSLWTGHKDSLGTANREGFTSAPDVYSVRWMLQIWSGVAVTALQILCPGPSSAKVDILLLWDSAITFPSECPELQESFLTAWENVSIETYRSVLHSAGHGWGCRQGMLSISQWKELGSF